MVWPRGLSTSSGCAYTLVFSKFNFVFVFVRYRAPRVRSMRKSRYCTPSTVVFVIIVCHKTSCRLQLGKCSPFTISPRLTQFNYLPLEQKCALYTARVANRDPFFAAPVMLVDLFHLLHVWLSPVQSQSAAPIAPAPEDAANGPAKNPVSGQKTKKTMPEPILEAVLTKAGRKSRRKAKLLKRRARGTGIHVSAVRC